jgi:CRP-like cAMP-binding protein
MDLLERARALAACPLFADLAPAVVVRLAERARPSDLAAGERRSTDNTVWVVAEGRMAVVARGEAAFDATASSMKRRGGIASVGHVVGLVRVVAPSTPVVEAIADQPTRVLALAVDDVRDVLEEDPTALASLAAALARLLATEPTAERA